ARCDRVGQSLRPRRQRCAADHGPGDARLNREAKGFRSAATAVAALFARLRAEKRCGVIAYVTCGDPDRDTTIRIVQELERAGADAIELGVPFSDPIADGPVIQAASQRALR